MSAITTDSSERQCVGKRSYSQKGDAKTAAKQAQANIAGGALHAYRCGRCGKFHVGHKPRWQPETDGTTT